LQAKKKSLMVKSRVTGKKHSGKLDYIDDEDEALMQVVLILGSYWLQLFDINPKHFALLPIRISS
jgi:hypothetical protein